MGMTQQSASPPKGAPTARPPAKSPPAELVEGPVPKAIMRLLLPMVIGLIAVISQPVVDTYFVGLLGTAELAAMAYIFPVAFIISSILIGVGIGATAVLARQFGAGQLDSVKLSISHTFLLGFLTVAVTSAILLPLQDYLFGALGADPSLLPLISEYMTVYLLGMVVMVPPMIGGSALRAKGDVKLSSAIMMVAAGANAIFDPLLIFGWGPIPALGFQGAALASLASNFLASLLAFFFMVRGDRLIEFSFGSKAELKENWKKVLHVGAPSALTNSISPISAIALVAIVSRFGQEAVAGWGVASRIEMLALIIPLSLSACIGPFVGQNMGAGRVDRMREGMRFAFLAGGGYCVFIFGIMLLVARDLATIFDDNPQTIYYATSYLLAVSASYPLYAFIMITAGAFNALGIPRPNMVLYSMKLLAIYLPCAWFGAQYFGFFGIVGAAILSNVVPGVVALWWYRKHFPKPRTEVLAEAKGQAA
jgi:putative MATE family efflux protein